MQVSISTTIFKPKGKEGRPMVRAFQMLGEAGFRLIEVSRKDGDLAEVSGLLADNGLRVWAVHGSLGAGAVSPSADERRREVERESRRMEDAAAFAPCPYVIHYLYRQNAPAIGDYWKWSVEKLLRRAEELSLILAVETVPFKPEVNERYADSKEVADFVRSLASKSARVCVDINHSNLNETLPEAIANCSGLIADIHVSDNHGHGEEHLRPGEGVINFPEAMQAVIDAGYEGPLNLECHMTDALEDLIGLRKWSEGIIAGLRT